MTTEEAPVQEEMNRWLNVTGTRNLRDIGGYETADGRNTRWRTLFRSDSMHRLDEAAQEELLSQGLRSVIDLRHEGETTQTPNVFVNSDRVAYHNMPLLSSRPDRDPLEPRVFDLEVSYRHMLDSRGAELAGILTTLAAPEALPAVIHCTAGKDRTGIVIALLLALAGVPKETIAQDYALTEAMLGEEYYGEARLRAEAANIAWEDYQRLLVCPPELMLRTLDYLETQHGGAQAYVEKLDLPEGVVEALQNALVD